MIGNPSTLSERLNLGLKKMSTLQYKSRRNREWSYAFGDSKNSLFNTFIREWGEPFSESFLGN